MQAGPQASVCSTLQPQARAGGEKAGSADAGQRAAWAAPCQQAPRGQHRRVPPATRPAKPPTRHLSMSLRSSSHTA